MTDKACMGCKHPVERHSEDVGCLECKCSFVRRDDVTFNPKGKYFKKEQLQ